MNKNGRLAKLFFNESVTYIYTYILNRRTTWNDVFNYVYSSSTDRSFFFMAQCKLDVRTGGGQIDKNTQFTA